MHSSIALSRIAPSGTNAMTDRAFELRAAGRDIISLSVGEPDFATPPHVIQAAKDALDAGDTRYTAVAGTAALREAAALHFSRDLGIEVPPAQVIASNGGKQSIFLALLATLDPGDEVLVPSPWWVSYPEIVRFAGATVVDLPTTAAGGFRITPAQLEAAITPATRWLLLNSPGNPTGATYPVAELQALGEVLRRHPQVMVLSDDIYAPLRYGAGADGVGRVEKPCDDGVPHRRGRWSGVAGFGDGQAAEPRFGQSLLDQPGGGGGGLYRAAGLSGRLARAVPHPPRPVRVRDQCHPRLADPGAGRRVLLHDRCRAADGPVRR